MPNKILEGCQRQNDVHRTVFWPMTGPQIKFLGIHFCQYYSFGKASTENQITVKHN